MAKKRGRRPQGGRVTPKGTRPRNFQERGEAFPRDDEPDLLAGVRRRLGERHPFALLAEVSSLYSALDPRRRNPFDRNEIDLPPRDDIVESFIEVDRLETSALLAVITEFTDDDILRARIRHELGARSHPLPPWMADLGSVEVYRTVEQVHVLGDGDNVLLGVRFPGGDELTFVVYIDHNLGRVAKDAFVIPEPVGTLIDFMREKIGDDDGGTRWDDINPADARARITEAIDRGARTFPPFETDTWPACRPLVEWMTRLLPSGGHGYEDREWTDAELEAIARRFLPSECARALAPDDDYLDLLDHLLWFGSGFGSGDPFQWSPVRVELLLADWLPRKIVAPADYLAKAPTLLRAFIRFAHAELGISPSLTVETLEAVDRWEPDYQETIRSDRPQGPIALLAAMGVVDPEGPWELPDDFAPAEEALRDWPPASLRLATDAPPDVVEGVGQAIALERFRALANFYGDGRKLTQTGNPTLADARSLIGILGTADEMDKDFGDRIFKTKSATELPELMFTLRWALASGVLRKEHGKLRATAAWTKPGVRGVEHWLRAVGALGKLGPLTTFYAHARFQGSHDVADEFTPELLHLLLDGPLPYETALDRLCTYADEAYTWKGYMARPEDRRRSFSFDLDRVAELLELAGILSWSGAHEEPDEWIPGKVRRFGGEFSLTASARWWLSQD